MPADGWVTLLRQGLNYRWSWGGQGENRASALSCHCRATPLTPPLHKLCPSTSRASFPRSWTVPPLKLPFLSSQGFLCNFLLKVKGNNQARAALQPPPGIAAPSMQLCLQPCSPTKARDLPSWLLLPAWRTSPEWRHLQAGTYMWVFMTFLWRPARDFQVYTKNSHYQGQQKKSFQPTKRNNNRLILSFPVLRQYSLSFSCFAGLFKLSSREMGGRCGNPIAKAPARSFPQRATQRTFYYLVNCKETITKELGKLSLITARPTAVQ